jgi:hypothetical protein
VSHSTFTNRVAVGLFVTFTTLVAGSVARAQSGYGMGGSSYGSEYSYSPSAGYGYGYPHAATVGESYLRGKAAVIDAIGNYEVNNGKARILRQEARSLSRENDLKQTEALLTQKKMWSDARIQGRKDRDARLAEGQLVLAGRRATIYRDAYQLSADELNSETGEIAWTITLQDSRFDQQRAELEELMRRHVGYGTPRVNMAKEIARSVDKLAKTLRNDVGSMSREDYLAAQKFLLGLKYGAAAMVVNS